MTRATTGIEECVRAVEGLFNPLIDTLWEHGRTIGELFDAPVSSASLLETTRPHAFAILAHPATVGAGFVVSPDLLQDEKFLLAWWQGDDKERIPDSIALVQSTDYTRQEWFRTPQRTHASHVTGPYIDYVCTDELMVTTTVPIERGDRMLGVMGADILAETIEGVLLDQFRTGNATLVNHNGRTVLSADPRLFAGEPVRRDDFQVAMRCTGLPLTVLA